MNVSTVTKRTIFFALFSGKHTLSLASTLALDLPGYPSYQGFSLRASPYGSFRSVFFVFFFARPPNGKFPFSRLLRNVQACVAPHMVTQLRISRAEKTCLQYAHLSVLCILRFIILFSWVFMTYFQLEKRLVDLVQLTLWTSKRTQKKEA